MLDVQLMVAADAETTATLFQEMQAHYCVPCQHFTEIVAKLAKLPVGVDVFVAVDQTVVGFAALSATFPGPGLNSGLFLKELFVSAQARGQGIGSRLMIAAAASPYVGRVIAQRGRRPVLMASAVLLAAGLCDLALATSLPLFLAAWIVMGLGMAAGILSFYILVSSVSEQSLTVQGNGHGHLNQKYV